LPRAAELAKPGEDQADGFLDPSIGIKSTATLTMPDEADRHADPQLAASTVATASDAPSETLPVSLPASEVENYLLAHQAYSHVSAMQGVAPFVRSVSEERVAVAK